MSPVPAETTKLELDVKVWYLKPPDVTIVPPVAVIAGPAGPPPAALKIPKGERVI
jgi:hypothetical protein